MKKLSILVATLGVTSILGIANDLEAQQVCKIHNDEPALSLVLAQPIPTTQIVPSSWSEVGNHYGSAQGHLSDANGRPRHFHIEFPLEIIGCEINGPFTFPVRFVMFQVNGYFDYQRLINENEDIQSIIWDETGTSTPPDLSGDPTDGAVVIHTAKITIDPTHPKNWRPEFNAPPHGWYNEQFYLYTYFTDGTSMWNTFNFPLYSMIDPSAPDSKDDPRYFAATLPYKYFSATTGPNGDAVKFYGTHSVTFARALPPVFGTLIKPWHPEYQNFSAQIYAGQEILEIFDSNHATTDLRIGQDLHHNIPGTILYQNHQETPGSGTQLPFFYDPQQLGTGDIKASLNWNFDGGPNLPDFPDHRLVTSILMLGIHSDAGGNTDTGDMTPPVVNLSGLLDGESVANGAQFTLSATATDASGIMQVQFFDNNVLITTDNTAPYTAPWSATVPGVHVIKAVAMDASSNMNTASAQVTVTVQNVVLTWNPVTGQDYRLLDNVKTCYDDGKCTDPVTVR